MIWAMPFQAPGLMQRRIATLERFRKSIGQERGPVDPHIAGEDDGVRRFDIRIVEHVGFRRTRISILILRLMLLVNKMTDRNTRCSFHGSLLVLGSVEGLLGKTFFRRGAQHNDLFRSKLYPA